MELTKTDKILLKFLKKHLKGCLVSQWRDYLMAKGVTTDKIISAESKLFYKEKIIVYCGNNLYKLQINTVETALLINDL